MHSKPRAAQFVHGLARLQRVFLSLQLSHAFFTNGCVAGPAGDLLTESEAVTSFDVVGGDRDGDEFAIQTFQRMTGTAQERRRGALLFSRLRPSNTTLAMWLQVDGNSASTGLPEDIRGNSRAKKARMAPPRFLPGFSNRTDQQCHWALPHNA